MDVDISWYGRCCFLVELNNKRVLFDPYDRFCNVDIGIIDADILISSSTWHDHGHIGASPKAWIFTYPGVEENSGFTITGIEAKENRGSPTVVFNLQFNGLSITNFADLGAEQDEEFEKSLTPEQKTVLAGTNIAFMRASFNVDEKTGAHIHNEKILKYCNPNIIIPEHYFPRSFIEEHIPNDKKQSFLAPNIEVDGMIEALGYPVEEIDDYRLTVNSEKLKYENKIVRFLKLHPQVKYLK